VLVNRRLAPARAGGRVELEQAAANPLIIDDFHQAKNEYRIFSPRYLTTLNPGRQVLKPQANQNFDRGWADFRERMNRNSPGGWLRWEALPHGRWTTLYLCRKQLA
jgi:hypothetical protein